ncbi:MAG: hypothetical protein AAGE94_24645 [Acidobacteriota bacterium]
MDPADPNISQPLDHRVIDEQAIAERYVTGRLPADLVAAFEEHYLECAECVARVEEAERLQRGLARAAAQEVARTAVTGGLLARLWRQRALRAAVPILLLALAIGPAFWQQTRVERLESELAAARTAIDENRVDESAAVQAGGKLVELSPLRGDALSGEATGGEPSTVLGLPFDADVPLVFALDVPPVPDALGYRVDLYDEAGTLLWQSSVGPLDPYDRLVLTLPAGRLPAGNVELRTVAVPIAPELGEQTVARFPLSVLRVM